MRIAFLSCDDLTGFVSDDHLLVKELTEAGHSVQTLSWSTPTDWRQFDRAVLRTTWDYTKRVPLFLQTLRQIEASQARLDNPLSVVEWNIHKRYLKELESKGVEIVPTHLFTGTPACPTDWGVEKFVVKPAIAAGGFENRVLTRPELPEFKTPRDETWLLQPFLEEIYEGEGSLLYFGGHFSHAVWKRPKKGEFRVQEEHGGAIQGFDAPPELRALGKHIVQQVPYPVLYARVDLLPYRGRHLLMELELIEPSLYLRMHPDAALHFRRALEGT